MPKREITAHKGGRTERINARLTPSEKQSLETLLTIKGLSISDYLMQCVKKDTNAK